MKAGVFYHSDFATRGYISLRYRVQPGFDALQNLIKEASVQVYTPEINPEVEDLLAHIHSPEHIERVKAEGYHEVALLSAAGVVEAASMLARGELDFAFCFVGTAGHHASYVDYWGYCFYNDVVMALKRLRQLGIKKTMVLDIDPHFGDGTRYYTGSDPDIIHINFHGDDREIFMNTDFNNYDIGVKNADDQYFVDCLDRVLSQEWNFELLIVIMGHDAHCLDYGDVSLTDQGFVQVTKRIKAFAGSCPVMVVLSGGSSPQVAQRVIPAVIENFINSD